MWEGLVAAFLASYIGGMVLAFGDGRDRQASPPIPTRESGPLVVMTRFARQLLVTSLVALHAMVMLCGPCLHGLPGWDHGARLASGSDTGHAPGPLNAAHVAPGHDAWTVGDEACVAVDFGGSSNYAKR